MPCTIDVFEKLQSLKEVLLECLKWDDDDEEGNTAAPSEAGIPLPPLKSAGAWSMPRRLHVDIGGGLSISDHVGAAEASDDALERFAELLGAEQNPAAEMFISLGEISEPEKIADAAAAEKRNAAACTATQEPASRSADSAAPPAALQRAARWLPAAAVAIMAAASAAAMAAMSLGSEESMEAVGEVVGEAASSITEAAAAIADAAS